MIRYNFNWLAWAVQHPAEQAGAAIVFIGDPGTGKGTLGKALCRLFGQHALHLSSAEDLTGKFNAHLRQCSFLFGDECYGPTDKRAEGQLKRMITENTLMIEPKGRDKVRAQNRLHVMLASNSEWVTLCIDGVAQVVEIERQPRFLGGTQGYWRCPRCEALRSHLYVLDGSLLCRVCGKLGYRSRHVPQAVARAAKLRHRLGGVRGLLSPLPRKPPHWSPVYYRRLVGELIATERVLRDMLGATVQALERRKARVHGR